jgi:hypothetical protein
MHFQVKNILKNNYYYTYKYSLLSSLSTKHRTHLRKENTPIFCKKKLLFLSSRIILFTCHWKDFKN